MIRPNETLLMHDSNPIITNFRYSTAIQLCKHVYQFTEGTTVFKIHFSCLSKRLTLFSLLFPAVYGPPRQAQLSGIGTQLAEGFRSVPQRLILILRFLFAGIVWGISFPLLMAEVWNLVLGVDTFPLYLEESWLPYSLNPVRLVVSGFKGVCITGGLFLATAIVFVLMEHIESFLDHVAFIRQHRRRRRNEAAGVFEPEDAAEVDEQQDGVEAAQDQAVEGQEAVQAPVAEEPKSDVSEPNRTPRGLDLKPLWIRVPTDTWLTDHPRLLELDTILTHRKMIQDLSNEANLRSLSIELHRYFEWRNEHNISTMGRLYNEKQLSSYWYAHYATYINQEALRKYAEETSIKRRFYDHFSLLAFRIVRGASTAWEESDEDDLKLSDSSMTESSKPSSARQSNLSPRDFGPSLSEDEEEEDHVPADEYNEQSSDDPLKSIAMYEEEEHDVARFRTFTGPFLLPEDAAEASAVAAIALLVHKILANKQIHAFRARRIHGDDASSSSQSSPRGLAMADEERKIWNLVDDFIKRSASENSEEDVALSKSLETAIAAHGTSPFIRGLEFGPDMSGSSSAPPSARLPSPEESSFASAQDGTSSEASPPTEPAAAHVAEPQVDAPIEAPVAPAPVEDPAVAPEAPAVILEAPAQEDPVAVPAVEEDDGLGDNFDDEDTADHRQNWMILMFGRRRGDNEEPPAQVDANNENNAEPEDNGFTDMIGLTGNPFWSLFILGFLLLLAAVAFILLVLVPQVTGKLLSRIWTITSAVLATDPTDETGTALAFAQRSYAFVLPAAEAFEQYVYPYLEPYVNHEVMPILLHPTSIGFVVCIAIILTVCAKRSPLAISARAFVSYVLEFFLCPIFVGTFTLLALSPVLQLDDPMTRPPLLSRHRATRTAAPMPGIALNAPYAVDNIMEAMDVPWQRDLTEQPLLMQVNETLANLTSSIASSINSTILDSSESVSGLNATLAATAATTIANVSSVANATAVRIWSPEFNAFIIQVAEQVESVFAYALTHFASVFVQLVVGYVVIITWVWTLRTLRRTLKREIMWFLPGDPDFSHFLHIANRPLRTLLFQQSVGVSILLVAILVFIGYPFYMIRIWNDMFNWKLFRVVVPSSSFQIFTDYNISFTLIPVTMALLKPSTAFPALLAWLAQRSAFFAGAQDLMLIGFPQAPPPPPPAPVPANAPANDDANDAPANGEVPVAPPQEVGPEPAPEMSLSESRLRIALATFVGSLMLNSLIIGFNLFPWMVGSFFVKIWIFDSDFLPMYTGTVGLYFLTVMTRIFMVYLKIWRLHYAARAVIDDNDRGARATLRRTTFDNGFRATVLILAIFVIIPIVLGYLIRIVFFYTFLPPHVLVPLSSPLEEYVVGIMGMQILNVISKLPLPWLVPIRAILDTMSFENILAVDYSAFLNQVVYPLASLVLVLGGVPSVANTLLAYFGTEIADDVLANLKRRMYALIPLAVFTIIMLYFTVMSLVRSIDQMINGRVVVARQIHNFNPAGAEPAAPQPVQVVQQNEPQAPPEVPQEDLEEEEAGEDQHPVLDDPMEEQAVQ